MIVLAVAGALLALTVASSAIGFLMERTSKKRIWDVPLAPGQYRHELVGNAKFFTVAVLCVSAGLASGAARLGDDGWLRGALTFGALFIAFQAYYYGLHRALHHRKLVRFHRHHHASHVTTPLSGQSMSIVESLGWMIGYVGLPIAMSYVVPISLTGWLAYLAFNVAGNIIGHANTEVIAPSPILRMRALFGATFTYHALHHARWTGHYGFESAWADRLFRSEYADWLTLHDQVWSGAPMKSLKERGAR